MASHHCPESRHPMKTLVTLLCGLLMTTALPAWADLSRDEAASVVQQASGARVLSVNKAEHEGRAVWRVKVLTSQGEVKVILIDAASGRTR